MHGIRSVSWDICPALNMDAAQDAMRDLWGGADASEKLDVSGGPAHTVEAQATQIIAILAATLIDVTVVTASLKAS